MTDKSSRRNGSLPPETHSCVMDAPFNTEQQLCRKLWHESGTEGPLRRTESKQGIQKDWLPGDPRLRLNDPQLADLLRNEYITPKLDAFSRHLWLVGRPESSHVASLTHQIVRGRRIILTDDPELHLVWIQDRVFIQPLPDYMLSHAFWEHFHHRSGLAYSKQFQRDELCKALAGFIRTYSYLVQHKSDFDLATHPDHRLISSKYRFSAVIQLLQTVGLRVADEDVSPRWRSGELRLSRLNFWFRVLLIHHNFAKVHGQYSEYVAQFYAPLLFVFAVLSVILNAMQAGSSIDQRTAGKEYSKIFGRMSKVFVPLSLFIVAVAVVWFLVAIAAAIARVALLGLKTHVRKRTTPRNRC